MRITRRILTLDLIRIAAGTGRKVWLTPTQAKKLETNLDHNPVVIADHLHDPSVPKGALLLAEDMSGGPGWNIYSKAYDGECGARAQEFYAPTARELSLALSAATWALNVARNHPTAIL